MKQEIRLKPIFFLTLVASALFFAGCHSNQQSNTTSDTSTATDTSDQSQQAAQQDENSGNLVPVSNTTTPSAAASSASAPADIEGGGDDTADESAYGVQPAQTAPQPPPALPQYDQPPCPDDGDIWTPGYWSYASAGYYWVPGAWVQAPYQGALWTPGYWGYSNNHYAYFNGYWGPHIGFYGGVNYGFGYVGVGYQGGYWNSGHFFYNRSVTNVNVTVIHNVYNRTVVVNNVNRVSFNGGPGGLQVRPRMAELAALREPHAPPMRTQIEIMHTASQNHAQFATVNHGRPASFVETRVVVADHDVHPAPIRNLRNVPEAARPMVAANRGAEPNRPEALSEPNRPEPARPEARPQPNHPEAAHPEARPQPNHAEPQRPEQRRAEPARPEAHPAQPEHAKPHPAPAERKPTPERKSEPRPNDQHPQA